MRREWVKQRGQEREGILAKGVREKEKDREQVRGRRRE